MSSPNPQESPDYLKLRSDPVPANIHITPHHHKHEDEQKQDDVVAENHVEVTMPKKSPSQCWSCVRCCWRTVLNCIEAIMDCTITCCTCTKACLESIDCDDDKE